MHAFKNKYFGNFTRFFPSEYSNVGILWIEEAENQIVLCIFMTFTLHCTQYGLIYLIMQSWKTKTSMQHRLWHYDFCKGVTKVWTSADCRLLKWLMIVSARCVFTDKMSSWLYILISYWVQAASLGHTPCGYLRGSSWGKTSSIAQKTGSELHNRQILIDNLRP